MPFFTPNDLLNFADSWRYSQAELLGRDFNGRTKSICPYICRVQVEWPPLKTQTFSENECGSCIPSNTTEYFFLIEDT